MVEGAALEKQCAGNRTVGSNPTLSATSVKILLRRGTQEAEGVGLLNR